MKRSWTAMIVAVVAISAMVVATATAAPPNCEELPIDHPQYCGSPVSTTTTTTEAPALQPCNTVNEDSGTGRISFACDWTPANDGSNVGTVTINTSREVSSLVVFVRDSAPGDICALEQWDRPRGTVFEASFPLADEGSNYWETGGVNWCELFDPVAGQRLDLNGEPLHLSVNLVAKKGTVVTVSLSPGQQEA